MIEAMAEVKNDKKGMQTDEFVGYVFECAVNEHASDVHFEPLSNGLRIRFRIDGMLLDRWMLPISDHEQIVNNIKVLGNLDISNHEVAQDGHFELYEVDTEEKASAEVVADAKVPKHDSDKEGKRRILDVRVSVYPTLRGETVVARILNRLDALLPLSKLGMDDGDLELIRDLISRDYGMILITGPVGSGKTTTLYSLIQELKSAEKNIMTIEDPVEFHLEWLRQSELKPARGFTFDQAMRSILRQDPDVLMIGEIRDEEAAEHAISVSLIGRIVGSTVHSNSTIGTIARLVDMEIDRSMIAYAINGIISQRLVRKTCEACRVAYEPDEALLGYFGLKKGQYQFFEGAGCKECNGSGFRGRVGIFEVLMFDPKMRSLIVGKASMDELESYALTSGMKTLKQDALAKAIAGTTSLDEVSKVV